MMRDCERRRPRSEIVRDPFGPGDRRRCGPYEVGTLAQLDEVEDLPDGGYNLTVVGAVSLSIEGTPTTGHTCRLGALLQDIPAAPMTLSASRPR